MNLHETEPATLVILGVQNEVEAWLVVMMQIFYDIYKKNNLIGIFSD